ncbi:PIN domain-containing protein [uncultured Enorma sp.]|uniref:type II toxin-antitoxin system VapC family toxin n=1 Tax=uncultured Enorma sp. TaxID=1714346 RepID=UPI00259AA5BC|nr:PIN domain-containing protein [uncultured Enorma sp.]
MASVVLDTNIILDYLSPARERHLDAVDLLEQLLESDVYEPTILAASIKDTYYILCRHFGARREEQVRDRLDAFRQIMTVAELTGEVLDRAFASDEPDLEDGIVRATAELLSAAAIVTRDREAYGSSTVPSMTAREFLQRML